MSSPVREVLVEIDTTSAQVLTGGRIKRMVCLELIDRVTTGAVFIQNEGDEFALHEFIEFVNDALLVCHDAVFVRRFLDTELERADPSDFFFHRYHYVDGHSLASKTFWGWNKDLYSLEKYLGIPTGQRHDHSAKSRAERFTAIYAALMLESDRKPIVFYSDEAWINHFSPFIEGKNMNGHINFYDEPLNPLEGIESNRVAFYSYKNIIDLNNYMDEKKWWRSHLQMTIEELADYRMTHFGFNRCNATIKFKNSKITIEWIGKTTTN